MRFVWWRLIPLGLIALGSTVSAIVIIAGGDTLPPTQSRRAPTVVVDATPAPTPPPTPSPTAEPRPTPTVEPTSLRRILRGTTPAPTRRPRREPQPTFMDMPGSGALESHCDESPDC